MKTRYILLCCCIVLLKFDSIRAQEVISLSNPSFEDTPHIGNSSTSIKQWHDCGQKGETPPDIQPNIDPFKEPFFGVTTKAYDGKTYLGMVTRDNETFEGIGQKLEKPLLAGRTYAFNLFLARSATYISLGRTGSSKNKPAEYTNPITIRIFGGNDYCEQSQLLATTEPVTNSEWKDYSLVFTPNKEYNYILIQAFYKTPTLFPYNGNILVDHLSDIVEVVNENKSLISPEFRLKTEGLDSEKYEKELASFKLSLKGSLSYATRKEIDSIVVDVVDRLTQKNMEIPLKIGVMRHADQFDQQIKQDGLRQFVLNTPKDELSKIIRCLEVMDIREPLNILKNTAWIFTKENKTEADIIYFENSDELWLEWIASESISDLRWKYFQRNKDAIIQEIVDLY